MARKPEQRNAPWSPDKPATFPADADADPRTTRVGDQLRGLYDDVLAETMPASFEELLRKLG